jgi:CheY-like chemotaxis protein
VKQLEGGGGTDVRTTAVLWIDDNPDPGAARLLADDGFQVATAATGAAGLAMALSRTYDVIIVDLRLPDLNGLTLMERLREGDLRCPLLAVTGYYLDDCAERHARAAGATAFRFKPLWHDDLSEVVRGLARSSARSSERQGHGVDDVLEQLLWTLERLTADGPSNPQPAESGPLLTAFLRALADPRLSLEGFVASTSGFRLTIRAHLDTPSEALFSEVVRVVRDGARRTMMPRHPEVRRVLDTLLRSPRWWTEDELARELALNRHRLWRLMGDDLCVDYRTLRQIVVMKAAALHVLTSDEYISQIAYRLRLHPGSLSRDFDDTFGCSPRAMRRLRQRFLPQRRANCEDLVTDC